MFKKKKIKTPFVVVLSFSRRTVAEIAKNTLSDKQILDKKLLKEKSYFSSEDYTFFNFVNDDNKVFRVIFQLVMKEKEKNKKKLFSELKYMFDCSDIEIINKQDFDFSKYNVNPLVRGEVHNFHTASKDEKIEESKPSVKKEVQQSPNIATVANEKYIAQSLESNTNADNKLNHYQQQNNNQLNGPQNLNSSINNANLVNPGSPANPVNPIIQQDPIYRNSNVANPANVLALKESNLNEINNAPVVSLSQQDNVNVPINSNQPNPNNFQSENVLNNNGANPNIPNYNNPNSFQNKKEDDVHYVKYNKENPFE
ncbi:hypothetical protein [Malacoplasma penetrans]|nr:hypothetical protein [Malacoplasma penetrans]